MPSESGSARKKTNNESPQSKSGNRKSSGNNNSNNNNNSSRNSSATGSGSKARKRKRYVADSDSELESELEDCNLADALAMEKRLRKVAKVNSLSNEEMRKLLEKVVKNEHILALVTLKAEDELARERREAEQRAIIITDTPSVPKLTRAKARELNKTPSIALPSLAVDSGQTEIAALIRDDLHSDEDDEEYTFQEEDFISDDDPNTTVSDLESNPQTPQTPYTNTDYENSPVKLTDDGCFKIPQEKSQDDEDLRIAARTRSKLCLEQTTIEDIESEFVPPDVEQCDAQEIEMGITDLDWMEFLNEFSRPLNSNGDDDDPINDPEYVAADKVPVDAEELRDINISKKELTELVAELFEGLVNEGVSLESIHLDTEPQNMVQHHDGPPIEPADSGLNTPQQYEEKVVAVAEQTVSSEMQVQLTRQLDFNAQQQICVSDATISSTNITQHEYNFQPNFMSTPGPNRTLIPVACNASSMELGSTISVSNITLEKEPEMIAIPVPGQPNCYQLAKVLARGAEVVTESKTPKELKPKRKKDNTRYTQPYDSNYKCIYISIGRHVRAEYAEKFEKLRDLPALPPVEEFTCTGFTQAQHDMLQQQLRIHVQFLTQHFFQTYSNPELWQMAPKSKKMLLELQTRAKTDVSFNAFNLDSAVQLVQQWEDDLSKDTDENRDMMRFIHDEIAHTNFNTRQIPRFVPRIMDIVLNNDVFMYPQYLPRIPFTHRLISYHTFSPAESQLVAMGLEKHIKRIHERKERLAKRVTPLMVACERTSSDTVHGKTKKRIWKYIKELRKADYYNPIKFYFDRGYAPPVQRELITFANNSVPLLKDRLDELPNAWRNYLKEKNKPKKIRSKKKSSKKANAVTVSKEASNSYLNFVREAVGEDIQLSETLEAAIEPQGSAADRNPTYCNNDEEFPKLLNYQHYKNQKPKSLTINVNYVFGSTTTANVNVSRSPNNSVFNSFSNSTPAAATTVNPSVPIVYNYDCNTKTLEPILPPSSNTSIDSAQRKLTDYYELHELSSLSQSNNQSGDKVIAPKPKSTLRRKYVKRLRSSFFCKVAQRDRRVSLKHRRKIYLQRRCHVLLTYHRQQLQTHDQKYRHAPAVQLYYAHFRALDLYTQLLYDLKMFCRNAAACSNNSVGSSSPGVGYVPQQKRARFTLEEEVANCARSKKLNRQEENLRNMLLPDTPEDANRKDAIYAFNFYEKVEEVLKSSKHPEDCKKFNHILKSFDPKTDKVADLYYKMENLFLPDHPELAQVFLTFLLPSQAADIGKFFEHFMITNMTTFVNKLNTYFNKQPAQIRKIYNSLNELAEEADVTIKKVKSRIVPLLRGNQFLIDWFIQQFPEEPPSERLLPAAEHVNLKEVQNNQSSEFMETLNDLLDSPTQEQQSQCQLRYINGRIFYGTKITLPAKLSFMATNCQQQQQQSSEAEANLSGCIHGIRKHGEKQLAAAASAAANENQMDNSDDNDKSEEEEFIKILDVDSNTPEEDDTSPPLEICDDSAMRAHAIRLNPQYYGNSCYLPAVTSTPNINANRSLEQQQQNTNIKKSTLDDCRVSPRKNIPPTALISVTTTTTDSGVNACDSPTQAIASPTIGGTLLREKRKSPIKKSRSPRTNLQPMVMIPQMSGAIACAKKLQSLIDEDTDAADVKDNVIILARTKKSINEAAAQRTADDFHVDTADLVAKEEQNSEDLQFLPENAEVTLSLPQKCLSSIEVDVESTDDQDCIMLTPPIATVTSIDSDDDRKLNIVTTPSKEDCNVSSTNNNNNTQADDASSSSVAWTRDEDKVILIEMKLGANDQEDLFERIRNKLPARTHNEIVERHEFLVDFLSKMHGK